MSKKILLFALATSFLLILIPAPIARAQEGVNPPPRKMEVIWETTGTIYTVDPAWCYDTASASLLFNVYEPVIDFDGEVYTRFKGAAATEAYIGPPAAGSPGYTNHTYYFKINEGVKFHTTCKGYTWAQHYLSAADAEYSYERWCIISPSGYAHWMIYESALGGLAGPELTPAFGMKIDAAFESGGGWFWINIPNEGFAPAAGPSGLTQNVSILPLGADTPGLHHLNYPPNVFLQVIAQSWASVLSKEWIINDVNPLVPPGSLPEWDGDWGDYTTWMNYHEPLWQAIDNIGGGIMCGTGPFSLDTHAPTTGYSLKRFVDYWGGWPADQPSPPYPPQVSSGIKPEGYIDRFTYVRQRDSSIRIADLKAGVCDFAAIPRLLCYQLHKGDNMFGETLAGIRLLFPVPGISVESWHMNFHISTDSLYMSADESAPDPDGDGVNGLPEGKIRADGIPPNFFSNIYVRNAFSYCINFSLMIDDYMKGEAYKPTTCAVAGLKYYNSTQTTYSLDTAKAIKAFQDAKFIELATGLEKSVWDVGFSCGIIYTPETPGGIRQVNVADIAARINALNPTKFHVRAIGLLWAVGLDEMWKRLLPAFHIGWLADYVDIHNFMFPYLSSAGAYGYPESYYNAEAEALLAKGIRLPDGAERAKVYIRLQQIHYEDNPSVGLLVGLGRGYQRDWMNGYFINPIDPGISAYSLWKWYYWNGDYDRKADPDGLCRVKMDDIMYAVAAFGATYAPGGWPVVHPRWNFWCDADDSPVYRWRDMKNDMYDIIMAVSSFGKSSVGWTP